MNHNQFSITWYPSAATPTLDEDWLIWWVLVSVSRELGKKGGFCREQVFVTQKHIKILLNVVPATQDSLENLHYLFNLNRQTT